MQPASARFDFITGMRRGRRERCREQRFEHRRGPCAASKSVSREQHCAGERALNSFQARAPSVSRSKADGLILCECNGHRDAPSVVMRALRMRTVPRACGFRDTTAAKALRKRQLRERCLGALAIDKR